MLVQFLKKSAGEVDSQMHNATVSQLCTPYHAKGGVAATISLNLRRTLAPEVVVDDRNQPLAAEARLMAAMHGADRQRAQSPHRADVVGNVGGRQVVDQHAVIDGVAGEQ